MNHEKHERHEKVLFREESYAIQGAVFDVYREMGSGFLETVYQECLAIEFHRRHIPFEAQKSLSLAYKGEPLQQIYRADFDCSLRLHWTKEGGMTTKGTKIPDMKHCKFRAFRVFRG
ncbi:MAG TPA: GxxExxY protein [Candidatus Limnocylindria bacterium]|nr:GxxExxY protein [Candidatus Limnocylindria bacterium]